MCVHFTWKWRYDVTNDVLCDVTGKKSSFRLWYSYRQHTDMGRHRAVVKCDISQQDVPGRFKADHYRQEHLSETFFCFLCHHVQYRFSNFINCHLPKYHQDDLGEITPKQLDLNSVAYWAVCPDTFNRHSKGPSMEGELQVLYATYLGETVDNRASNTFMDYIQRAQNYGLNVRVNPPNRFPEELGEPAIELEEPPMEPQNPEPRREEPMDQVISDDDDDDCSIIDIEKPRVIFLNTERDLGPVPPLPLPVNYPSTLGMLDSTVLGSLPSACEIIQTREDRIVVYEGAENFLLEQPRGFREETVTVRYRSPGCVTYLKEEVNKEKFLIYLMPAGQHEYQYAEELQK